VTIGAFAAGAVAGVALGYVLQRADLCFHSAWGGLLQGRTALARAWILGVAVASVGLCAVYSSGRWPDLNQGLAFRPVANVTGGLVIGAGMAVASSCVSGLFYKLGSGMVGAGVGLLGWAAGELIARPWHLPGPELLPGGAGATIPAWLGVSRWAVAVPFAAVVVGAAVRSPSPENGRRWGWRRAGIALGLATVAAWILAGAGGAGFGTGTVGLAGSLADRRPDWWLVAFLLGIVAGALVAAHRSATWWWRGERPAGYRRLAAGGALLGAGGQLAGGCNLGHGLSGVAQLNVSSWVVVGAVTAGIALTRAGASWLAAAVPGAAPRLAAVPGPGSGI